MKNEYKEKNNQDQTHLMNMIQKIEAAVTENKRKGGDAGIEGILRILITEVKNELDRRRRADYTI